MTDQHFNGLSPAQAERFAFLCEELGEVQQIIGKILRHGLFSHNPVTGSVSNRELLHIELGDVLAAIDLLVNANDLDFHSIENARAAKREKVKPWMHHQGSP